MAPVEYRNSGTMANLCHVRSESALGLFFSILMNKVRIQAIFSFVAAHLARSLAKYAAGSGISEIKCILAGFIMHGFLGYATFFIKSLTLVSSFTLLINNDIDQE